MTKITIETENPAIERLIHKALEAWTDRLVTNKDLKNLDEVKQKADALNPTQSP